VYCVPCDARKLCMYSKFIFVLWYAIVAFRGTTMTLYFSFQSLNKLVKESVVEAAVFLWEWDSIVGTATCYGLESPGFNPWWGQGIFCSPKLVETGPGTHPASSSGHRGSSGAVKWPGHGVVEAPVFLWEWDSIVGTATCYGLESPGFNPWWGQGIFCSPKLVETGPGAHPASSSGHRGSSGAVKRPGHGVVEAPVFLWEWDSIVGTATCYGLDGESRVQSLVRARDFLFSKTCWDWPCGLPGLLQWAPGIFWGREAARAWCWPPTPHLMPRLVQSRAVHRLSRCAFIVIL